VVSVREIPFGNLLTSKVTAQLPAPQISAEEAFDEQEVKERLAEALDTLTFREREVIKARFAIGRKEPLTLDEVGRQFRISRERVRQIEARALRKLQHPFSEGAYATMVRRKLASR
jgi:RNA polymerase sigma factor (sigma-70 family)